MIAYDGYMKVCLGVPFDHPMLTMSYQIPRISIFDEAAMRYVLGTETYNFPKPMYMRRLLGQVFGLGKRYMFHRISHNVSEPCTQWLHILLGIVVAEGSDHARQRKIMVCSKTYSYA